MNTTREQIVTLIQQGKSNSAISRELHCDKARARRIRQELGLPNAVLQPLTLEEKWAARTRQVDGGHLEWLGEQVGPARTPVMRYKEKSFTAAGIAFRVRTGRDPVGYVLPGCGRPHCVAPDHVEDEPERQRTREQLRYLQGGQKRPERCVHGHDMATHGRFTPDGQRSYCEACKAARRQEVS